MDVRPDFARYAVRHPDGRWLYHLKEADRNGLIAVLAEHADNPGTGHPMTRLGERSAWWSTTAEAVRITLLVNRGRLVTGYRLNDPQAASVKYPATLTVEEWAERREEATGAEIDRLWSLYSSVAIPQEPAEMTAEGPFLVLEGSERPPADGPQWSTNLVDAITQRPEYQHLFPGRLIGLRKHVMKAINRLPQVQHCFDGFQGDPRVYVSLRVPYEKPETYWSADISSRTGKPLKSGRTKARTVERTLHLPIPTDVPGDNYVAALAKWDRQVEFWLAAVTDASVAACNHCRGTGHVPTGYGTPPAQ